MKLTKQDQVKYNGNMYAKYPTHEILTTTPDIWRCETTRQLKTMTEKIRAIKWGQSQIINDGLEVL